MSTPSTMTTPAGTPGPGSPDRPAAHGGGAHPRPVPPDGSALSFHRLVRLELRKALDTRAGRGLVIAVVLATAVALGLTMWLLREEGAGFDALLLATTTPQSMLVPVLGILTVCSEWSQRTALITFTQEPRRLRVMAAKTVAAGVLGLAVLAATLALTVLSHVASMALADGGRVDVTLTLAQIVNLTVAQIFSVLQGVAFGALFLSVPVAIVAFFLLPVVVNVLTTTVGFLGRHAQWFDTAVSAAPLMGREWLTGQQWAHLGVTGLLWLVLPLAVGCWRVARKEVK